MGNFCGNFCYIRYLHVNTISILITQAINNWRPSYVNQVIILRFRLLILLVLLSNLHKQQDIVDKVHIYIYMEVVMVTNKTVIPRIMHFITHLCPRIVTSICTIQVFVLKVLVAKQQTSKILSHVSHTVHTLSCKSV